MIEALGLTKNFGSRRAVDNLTLRANAGEIYGFLGHNGAGKTTTIRMLLGILKPDEGQVRICGQELRPNSTDVRRLIGAVSEIQYLYDDMTCGEYLSFFAALYGVEGARRRTGEVLDEVGLLDREHDLAVTLSKGLQQKLGLARALLHDPPILILDEPVSGLDPNSIRDIRQIICRQRERGRLVFLSSHVLSEVERTADRLGIMRGGQLVYSDTVEGATARFGSVEQAFLTVTSGSFTNLEHAA
jgi:ABC-2 type transport system ATP-binding protein